MKPSDIVIGKFYKHNQHPNILYLGCGYVKHNNCKNTRRPEKHLVILGSTVFQPCSDMGNFVRPPKYCGGRGFWAGFSAVEP